MLWKISVVYVTLSALISMVLSELTMHYSKEDTVHTLLGAYPAKAILIMQTGVWVLTK